MADKKYAIVQISGGLGKHIALTAGLQVIKNAHPDRKLIAVVAWPELFANLPFVDRVYPLGGTQYFYEEYVEDNDSLIFAQEVYFTTPHILKQKPMIESWCEMYGLKHNGEQPALKINPEQKKAIRNFYEPKFEGKPLLLLHTNGGLYQNERPFCWARDMPIDVATKVANHFKKSHFVIQITRPTSEKIEGVFVRHEQLSNTELVGLVELSSKRLLIDSSLQHAAAAFGLPSTVLWNATSSTIFGHSIHDNIQAKEKPKKSLPGSYLFDYQFDANENEFPYEEGDLKDLYNVDQIIASLEAQTNAPKKGFG
jgi:ADP-heptose:LPS heptosyltransferase